jgi:hypothetical protein
LYFIKFIVIVICISICVINREVRIGFNIIIILNDVSINIDWFSVIFIIFVLMNIIIIIIVIDNRMILN